MNRPITTLFLLASADGKISTGASDELDFDRDLPKIKGAAEGLYQYYDIEQTTDLWSLNSGRVQAKMGVNDSTCTGKTPVSFVLVDTKHLRETGINYFCDLSDKFVLITTNPDHPAFKVKRDNLYVIYQRELSLPNALEKLKADFGCDRLTIQSGGTLNELFLREKLIDYVDLVIAPILVGGKDTSTVIDGEAPKCVGELSRLGVLELQSCTELKHSYVRLRYKVIA